MHPKVAAGGIGGALALVIMYGLSFAITIPPEVAAAVGVLSTSLCAYLAPWVTKNQPGA